MSDRLLRELGDLARSEAKAEEARFDDRWDRLAAGTLTAEEETELKALADSSPEYREAYEAFRPLGADFQTRVVSAIKPPKPPKPPPPVPPFWRVVPRPKVWAGFAAAAAAVVAVRVFFPVQTPPLPGYEAHLSGGFKASRGEETAPPNGKRVFTPGSPFTLELSPKEPLENPGKVKPSAFLSSSAGREDLSPLGLKGKIEAGETGSILLNATMGEDIKVPPGDWILWTVVARNSLPKAKEVEARLRANQPREASWQNICDALHKEESPPSAPSSWQVACADFRVEGLPAP